MVARSLSKACASMSTKRSDLSLEQAERYRQYNREWYAKNKGKAAEYARSYREKHPDAMRRYVLQRHGATEEWFQDQLAAQGGLCAICLRELTPGNKTHIDHDHATGALRGILCHHCNHMLGHARDSQEVLIAAARYLEGVRIHVRREGSAD